MKIIKLYYFNDEKQSVVVRVIDTRYDAAQGSHPHYKHIVLKPTEGMEFDLHVPDNAILWVKKWASMVMLSYQEQSVQLRSSQPAEPPPPEDFW